jgi:hypothetical protein
MQNKKKLSMFEKFGATLAKENGKLIMSMPGIDSEYFSQRISCLFRLTPPEKPIRNPRQFSPYENLLIRLFDRFFEIDKSVRNLYNTLIYIRRFPFSKTRIERSTYLRYHYENYLSELYILKERMLMFLKIIARLYKRDPNGENITRITNDISRDFINALSSLIETRGIHIHEERYSDLDFSQLDLFEIFKDEKIPGLNMNFLYGIVYKRILKAKRNFIRRTNKQIEKRLEIYFKILFRLLFDKDEHLLIPINISPIIAKSNITLGDTIADRLKKLKKELESEYGKNLPDVGREVKVLAFPQKIAT